MKKGDFIRINYVARLESGEVFDLTDAEIAKKEKIYSDKIRYGPLPIIVGVGFVIPGLDKALAEMTVGDKKNITVEPKDGFGERNAEMIKTVPEKAFKDQKLEPQQGMIVDFGGMKGRIQSVSAGRVRVDFNNPLAGKKLLYDIEVVEKIDDTVKQIQGVFEFFGAPNIGVRIENREAFINAALPHEMKQKLSGMILENVSGLDKLTFQETYTRNEKHADHGHEHGHEGHEHTHDHAHEHGHKHE
jgi:FKBP-type peptidyl-prolyl cis-trans isomerase 2